MPEPPAASHATVAAVILAWVAELFGEPATRMPEPQPRLAYGLYGSSAAGWAVSLFLRGDGGVS
jgi:hypothetical protein